MVDLKVVKYNGLVEAIKAQRGKVVVVDVWAEFCLPCMKAFPHLVEMHRKHGSEGVVCLSISLDPLERKPRTLAFLQQAGATFPNYLIDEEQEFWQKRFGIIAPPAVFVFNQEGRRAGKFDTDDADRPLTYADVEKLVLELLRGKQ